MRKLLTWMAVLGFSPSAWALDAQAVRGGWETTLHGVPQILELRIRGSHIAKNEMEMDLAQDNMQRPVSMTIFGPVGLQATHLQAADTTAASSASH